MSHTDAIVIAKATDPIHTLVVDIRPTCALQIGQHKQGGSAGIDGTVAQRNLWIGKDDAAFSSTTNEVGFRVKFEHLAMMRPTVKDEPSHHTISQLFADTIRAHSPAWVESMSFGTS